MAPTWQPCCRFVPLGPAAGPTPRSAAGRGPARGRDDGGDGARQVLHGEACRLHSISSHPQAPGDEAGQHEAGRHEARQPGPDGTGHPARRHPDPQPQEPRTEAYPDLMKTPPPLFRRVPGAGGGTRRRHISPLLAIANAVKREASAGRRPRLGRRQLPAAWTRLSPPPGWTRHRGKSRALPAQASPALPCSRRGVLARAVRRRSRRPILTTRPGRCTGGRRRLRLHSALPCGVAAKDPTRPRRHHLARPGNRVGRPA